MDLRLGFLCIYTKNYAPVSQGMRLLQEAVAWINIVWDTNVGVTQRPNV